MAAVWHKKYSVSRYLNLMKTLRRFFRDFIKRPEFIENIKVRWVKVPPKFKQLPTVEQLRDAFNAIKGVDQKALFLFYLSTGLRRSEVLSLPRDAILWEHRAVIPQMDRDTKKTGITFFTREAEAWLKYHLQLVGESELLFPTSDKRFKKLWKYATIGAGMRIGPQLLRKWNAVRLRMAGVPDSFVDVFQGRAPRSTLARYYTPVGIQELRAVYEKAEPYLTLGVSPPPRRSSSQ